ncbi:MAG: caspase domain-containing protein [Candidatus Baltobacteraceae bacterium]
MLHARLFGVSRYDNGDLLGGCGNDAARTTLFLRSRGYNAQPFFDGAATKSTILSELRGLVEQLRAEPGSFGVFYFSGHGFASLVDGKPESMLCPADWLGCAPQSGVLSSEMHDIVQPLRASSSRLVAIFDACCSGGMGPWLMQYADAEGLVQPSPLTGQAKCFGAPLIEPKDTPPFLTSGLALFDGITILSACAPDAVATEVGSAPFGKDEGPGGVFTYALLDVLRDTSETFELHSITAAAAKLIKDNHFTQTPQIIQNQKGEVLFPSHPKTP